MMHRTPFFSIALSAVAFYLPFTFAADPTCNGALSGVTVDNNDLYQIREYMCGAAGCVGQENKCKVTLVTDKYFLSLNGNPQGQTETQFSQSCYDAVENIIKSCFQKQQAGGSLDVGGGNEYSLTIETANPEAYSGADEEGYKDEDTECSTGDAGPRGADACCEGLMYCSNKNTCVAASHGAGDVCNR